MVKLNATKSVSPGEALRMRRTEERRTRAYGELSVLLQRGDVGGELVSRLHTLIGGNLEALSLAETEMAMRRMGLLHDRAMTQIRNLRA